MPEGFFSTKEIESKTVVKAQSCAACGLYKNVLSPKIQPFGDFEKKILVIGEAPGEVEDRRGRPWQGPVGRRLQQAFKDLGIDLFRDCLSTNSIICRPTDKDGNNRPPANNEISCCKPILFKVIEEYKPKVIILLGGAALQSVIGERWKKDLGTISQWRGFTIPDRFFRAWICPGFHPSFVERGEKEVETVWMQDLERAISMADVPFPEFQDEASQVEIVDDPSFILDMKGPVAFDYEATGLKPHDTTRHSITCMSICNSLNKAYAFMMSDSVRRIVRKFLKSPVEKIAQNMKYEHTWSHNILNCEVNNWIWDTMLATHVLDNRSGITGLKFQAYVRFGIADYSSDVEQYIKTKGKNANDVNRIQDLVKSAAGRKKLLTYCGIDSLLEYRLAMLQMKEL